MLTVRKRGTTGFMLPGGKPEPGESYEQAAAREVFEELGLKIPAAGLQKIGVFTTAALNEADTQVEGHVFLAPPIDTAWNKVYPRSEIEQLRWVHPATGNHQNQAPLNLEAIFPALLEHIEDYDTKKSLAVYLGSSDGTRPEYAETARTLGAEMARRGICLVYGGAKVGLMGQLANAVKDAGGEAIGVIPDFMTGLEKAHEGLDQLEVVSTMHERKALMMEEADAFVALPGGPGTLEEFFEVMTWRRLGLHHKPVILLNAEGYWNSLLATFTTMTEGGFMGQEYWDAVDVVEDIDQLFALLGW